MFGDLPGDEERSKSSHRSKDSKGRRSKSPASEKGYNPNVYYGKDQGRYQKETRPNRGYDSRDRRVDSRDHRVDSRDHRVDSRYRGEDRYPREDNRSYHKDERYVSKRDTKVY
jgi:hypothetical protein